MKVEIEGHRKPIPEEVKDEVRRLRAEADRAQEPYSFEVCLLDLKENINNAAMAMQLQMIDSGEARGRVDAAIAQYVYRMRAR